MNSTKKIIGLLFIVFSLSGSIKAEAQEAYLGEIRMFAGNFAPRGWAFCDGQLLAISSNNALFSLLGTMYGGDGRTTFALPDLRGRVPMSAGLHPGSSYNYRVGQRGGIESPTLSTLQMPQHNHTASVSGGGGNILLSTDSAQRSTPQAGDVPASAQFGSGLSATQVKAYGPPTNTVNGQTVSGGNVTIGFTGASQPYENRQPYTIVRYIICLQGVYPSRS
ncbi:phage tail protein [Tenacibaculum sp. ZS6-P6]|uniref:phage tail protein n=1 Tax=Tenacibaculum sp. ZS6-P6 TaxID=3447503 RepID=UPI003F950AC6